jgi:hypothetical protein
VDGSSLPVHRPILPGDSPLATGSQAPACASDEDLPITMDSQSTFERFLATEAARVSLTDFVVNLFLTFVLAWILKELYQRFAHSHSNRRRFASNFPTIALTTMLIITVVKSSLALSLGLVGALSIVRFRTAIKDPEELSFLFITIALGLGLGAGQREVTLVGFTLLSAAIAFRSLGRKQEGEACTVLTISGERNAGISVAALSEILSRHCESVDLKRFDEGDGALEATFQVEFSSFDELEAARRSLAESHGSLRLSLLESGAR